jgi:hypothetical protein
MRPPWAKLPCDWGGLLVKGAKVVSPHGEKVPNNEKTACKRATLWYFILGRAIAALPSKPLMEN